MDPASALGTVSAIFQIFSGCVKVYQLIAEAHGMPKTAEYLRVRLQTERHRLLNWAEAAELTEENEALSHSSRNRARDVLNQKEQLLLGFVKLEMRYTSANGVNPTSSRVDDGDIVMIMDEVDNAAKPISRTESEAEMNRAQFPPKRKTFFARSLGLTIDKSRGFSDRVRWVAFDKKKFETLLEKLNALNDYMMELLSLHQRTKLEVAQEQTHFQIMQMNSKVDTLLQIFQAGYALTLGPNQPPISQALAFLRGKGLLEEPPRANEQMSTSIQLAQLARSKAFNESIDQGTLDAAVVSTLMLEGPAKDPKKTALNKTAFQFDPDSRDTRCEAKYRQQSDIEDLSVWIEWKELDVGSHPRLPTQKVLNRVQKLAAVLVENENPISRVPHCLGYIEDLNEDLPRVGYVFEKPLGTDSGSVPISLLQLLSNESHAMPSLTKRVSMALAIAQSLQYMHAINWLHKGIRSDNVLFFGNSSRIDYSRPYVSGFDYSRPAHSEEMTEIPRRDSRRDIYRHPHAQKDFQDRPAARKMYEKTYDIYSLGVVLMEIAIWQPIQDILHLNIEKMRAPDTRKVCRQLLYDDDNERSEFLHAVGGNVGEKYEEVVRVCLSASEAFGLRPDDDQTSERVGVMIQEQFFEQVVAKLEMITT